MLVIIFSYFYGIGQCPVIVNTLVPAHPVMTGPLSTSPLASGLLCYHR
jgi:hypothetical protein